MAAACPNEDFLTRSCQLCGAWKRSQSAMALLTPDGMVLQCNPACEALTGSAPGNAVGKGFVECLFSDSDSQDSQPLSEAIALCGTGRQVEYDLESSATPLRVTLEPIRDKNGRVSMILMHTHSISEHLKIREALERRAHYDPLTGLPNRLLFTDRLQQSLARARRENHQVAVCYLDLDGFKAVNDRLGHAAGDLLLTEISRRLQDAVRGGDTVARIGGDEFILILGNIASRHEIDIAMERVIDTVAKPVTLDAQEAHVTASIGIALFPQQSDDADILVRFADMAMYVAKQSGKNQVSYHDPDLARASIHHFELLQSIKKGFESGEFELYYQPKVSMREGRVVGVEALLRWRHPQRGLLSPGEFLEVLDASELAISAGCWVLREVVRQADTWRRQGICLDVSINVSSKHFEFPDFLCDLKAALAEAPDLPRNTLEIEIGESDALRNSDYTERVISECAALGVSCAIDDYGKQSFANSDMPRLPAHTLKLDRCIIADLLHNSADLALIDGIIALATTYQQDVVAKGIESAEHAQMLIKMGCDMAQGYGIASPMSAREIPAWIDAYDLELCGHQVTTISRNTQ